MNEFIVWDKRYRVFRKLLKIDFELGLYFCIDTVVPFEKGELVKDIGIKDINGKSIYANSSIVEFEWGQDRHNIIGYFAFNKEYLSYEIIMLNTQKGKSMCYAPHNCFNLKIIDTIQENKLGLIK